MTDHYHIEWAAATTMGRLLGFCVVQPILSSIHRLKGCSLDDLPDAPHGTVDTFFAPIHSAARMRDLDTVRKQLELGVDVDLLNGRAQNGDGGNAALWFAAQGPPPCGIEIAKVLVEAGAEVSRKCEHGTTALHIARAWGHLEMVTFLIGQGAEHLIEDDDGLTPLLRAEQSNYRPREVVSLVVEYLRELTG